MQYYEVSEAVNKSLRFYWFVFSIFYAIVFYLIYPDLSIFKSPHFKYIFLLYILAVGLSGLVAVWIQSKMSMAIYNKLSEKEIKYLD